MTECSALRCNNAVDPDGCRHMPEEPWCAEHLGCCPECLAAIKWDMPRAAS